MLPVSDESDGRRFPAEWEPAAAIWIAWPHHRETWPGRFDKLPEFFTSWTRLIADVLAVRILADGDVAKSARTRLGQPANVEFVPIPTNDCWIRDYGPSFVLCRGQLAAIDWHYNAWGGKYPPWDDDNRAASLICKHANIRCHQSDLCLEGGAIESDGKGRLLTTPCLLTESRNPSWTKRQIAEHLFETLGVTEIAWIDGGGLAGDDTDGHIDQLARFVDERQVVVATSGDRDDPNTAGLMTNLRQLECWGSTTDPNVEIHPMPIPPPRFIGGVRVPESYCNFLRLGDQCTLVPEFGCKQTDEHAAGLLEDLTGTDVISVDCHDLVWGLGAMHCASLNQPRSI